MSRESIETRSHAAAAAAIVIIGLELGSCAIEPAQSEKEHLISNRGLTVDQPPISEIMLSTDALKIVLEDSTLKNWKAQKEKEGKIVDIVGYLRAKEGIVLSGPLFARALPDVAANILNRELWLSTGEISRWSVEIEIAEPNGQVLERWAVSTTRKNGQFDLYYRAIKRGGSTYIIEKQHPAQRP